jgi:hypothetical protein
MFKHIPDTLVPNYWMDMDSCDPEIDCISMIWDCLDNGDDNWSDTTDNSELYQDLSEVAKRAEQTSKFRVCGGRNAAEGDSSNAGSNREHRRGVGCRGHRPRGIAVIRTANPRGKPD